MATFTGSWALHGFGMFSVIEKASGRWIGRLGPWAPEGWPGTEVGWGLAREAWGKGYATEGSAATMDWAIDTLGWSDIIHSIDPDNEASIRSRAGSDRTIAGPASCRLRSSISRSTSGARPANNGGRPPAMKPMTEQHLAILRRHMVEVIDMHFDLAGDEIGKDRASSHGCARRC